MYEKLETFLINYINVRKVGDIFNKNVRKLAFS